MAKKSLTEAVSAEIKSKFNLDTFKAKKGLDTHVKFKQQRWIPFSPAISEAVSLPGVPLGAISLARGLSDSGKTTLLIEVATAAQKMGILPVFIITEMKWDFNHANNMGFQLKKIIDENDPENVKYEGFFLYADRSTLNSIEDVSDFILDMLDEQKKGNLPYDLLFLWDSVGSIPCNMSLEANKNNPQWNAGAMATNFGNFVNQKFPMSRKADYPYTNSLLAINKTGILRPESPMGQPKRTNKAGDTMFWDATVVITFGNITNSGTSKLQATKNGKKVEFAKRTKICSDKTHTDDGITTISTVIMTPHGFIKDDPKEIDKYKKEHSHEWFSDGKGDITYTEDNSEWDETTNVKSLTTLLDEIE
jgi:hypothetical protein